MPKLYDHIKKLLEESREYRNSDRKLIWKIWCDEGLVWSSVNPDIDSTIPYCGFMKATSPETIRRTRQKVQQDHPELQSDKSVLKEKKRIQDQRGTHVYREELGNDGEEYDLEKEISKNDMKYDELKEQGKLF